jgi:hypothetical protein
MSILCRHFVLPITIDILALCLLQAFSPSSCIQGEAISFFSKYCAKKYRVQLIFKFKKKIIYKFLYFQNLVFQNLFEFSVAEITSKSISPTF